MDTITQATTHIAELSIWDEGHFKEYKMIPRYMLPSLERYILSGVAPGGFLKAVICNDLSRAVAQADKRNMAALEAWVKMLHNRVPLAAHGSPERYANWLKHNGLERS